VYGKGSKKYLFKINGLNKNISGFFGVPAGRKESDEKLKKLHFSSPVFMIADDKKIQ